MNSKFIDFREKKRQGFDHICVTSRGLEPSLPADVLWGSFITHSFLPHGEMKVWQTNPMGRLRGGYLEPSTRFPDIKIALGLRGWLDRWCHTQNRRGWLGTRLNTYMYNIARKFAWSIQQHKHVSYSINNMIKWLFLVLANLCCLTINIDC